MPNGGSDCCGTCWFNAQNKEEAGYGHANDPQPANCTIRDLAIEKPFYTYCGNHPYRRPKRDPIPIGPVFVYLSGDREIWRPSPDTEEIRQHLLSLLADISPEPVEGYPLGFSADELVILQLEQFGEIRAIPELERIASWVDNGLSKLAQEVLIKINTRTKAQTR